MPAAARGPSTEPRTPPAEEAVEKARAADVEAAQGGPAEPGNGRITMTRLEAGQGQSRPAGKKLMIFAPLAVPLRSFGEGGVTRESLSLGQALGEPSPALFRVWPGR